MESGRTKGYPRVRWTSLVAVAFTILLVSGCDGAANQAIAAPANIEAAAVSADEVIVSWSDGSSGEEGFVVERSSSADGDYAKIAAVGANQTVVTDQTVDASTRYFYRVGTTGGEAVHYGGTVTVATPAAELATPHITGVSPVATSVTGFVDVEVEIAWEATVPEPDEVTVVRHYVEGGAYEIVGRVPGSQTYYTEHVTGAGRYEYALRAVRGEEVSALSDVAGVNVGVRSTIGSDSYQVGFEVLDLDLDGDADFLSASDTSDSLTWWENDGTASFTAQSISTTISNPRGAVSAFVDPDERPDVIAYSRDGFIRLYIQAAAEGTFDPPVDVTAALNNVDDLTTADINEDGDVDLVSAADDPTGLVWWESSGGYSPGFTLFTIDPTSRYEHVGVADVDGDGDFDVVGYADGFGELRWFENDGSEGFTEHTAGSETVVHDLQIADVDGDGDPDILISSDEALWLFCNDGDGAFAKSVVDDSRTDYREVRPVDFSGDGLPEIVVTAFDSRDVVFLENRSRGTEFAGGDVDSALDSALSVGIGDFDGDHDSDIVAGSLQTGEIRFYDM